MLLAGGGGLRFGAQFLEILRQELGYVLELGNVSRIQIHQEPVGFQAGSGELFRRGMNVVGSRLVRTGWGLRRAVHGPEQIRYAEVIEQVGNPFVRIEENALRPFGQ